MEAGASPYKNSQRKPWWKQHGRWLFPCLLALGVAGGGGGVYALHHHDDSNSKLPLYEQKDTCYLADQDEATKRAYAHRDEETKKWQEIRKSGLSTPYFFQDSYGYKASYHVDRTNPDLLMAIVEKPPMTKKMADRDKENARSGINVRYVVLCELTVPTHSTDDIN